MAPTTHPSASSPSFQTLEIQRDGAILRVWLARPDRLNAIDTTMLQEVGDLFASLETDWETRVVVLGGRGRSFCAGADRKGSSSTESAPETDRALRWKSQLGRRACQAIQDCEVPVVARLHGHVIGGGACFAMACDFRVASSNTVLRIPEVDLGIPLTWGATPRLIHEIGAARARELLMLCEPLEAPRGGDWGLFHRVVGEEDLDDATDAMARQIASKPEMAIYMTRTQLRAYAATAGLGDVTESDGDLLRGALSSASAKGRFAMKRDE
jgi:enoyl-CoA hydratase/carnithine racemase